MERASLRVFIIISAAVFLGCGSKDGSHESAIAADAGDDARNVKDAAAPHGADAHVRVESHDAGKPDTITTGSCGELSCTDPATCSEKDGKASCHCPSGYNDVHGDGSACEHADACDKAADQACGKHAHCVDGPDGRGCACDEPAYKGDAENCECADGYEQKDGLCLASDGAKCGDDIDCANSHCESGICCKQACSDPGAECHTSEGASCADGHTCKYPLAKNGSACDDAKACTADSTCKAGACVSGSKKTQCDDGNPCTDDSCDDAIGCKNQNNTAACDDSNACTQNDHCSAGACTSTTLRDCTSGNDACNTGVCEPASGNCAKHPVADGTVCDDANSCTTTDACNAGTCSGMGNACGPNATACSAATPNACTCASNYVAQAGQCVPNSDECAQNPCSPDATCFDPSNDANTVQCTCKPGFSGDGKTCSKVDPCAGNPCGDGRGTCAAATDGKYSCTCGTGYVAVAGQCVCDMAGTFALREQLELTWQKTSTFESGTDTTTYWSIVRHKYDAQGNLALEKIMCGVKSIDLCGLGVSVLVAPEAYAQYQPSTVWSTTDRPGASVSFSLPNALPKAPFVTPSFAALSGISLTDPAGDWPGTRKDVQGSDNFDNSAVNGARWVDADNDGVAGVTTYPVGPDGAVADGSPNAPTTTFAKTSAACPRGNASAARLPYNYPPGVEGVSIQRIKRISSANRIISSLNGTLASCDQISGTIGGPSAGGVRFDTRIAGCVRINGSGETGCSDTLIDFADTNTMVQQSEGASSFVARRVADTVTCEEVRNYPYD
jgi:EGF-like domain